MLCSDGSQEASGKCGVPDHGDALCRLAVSDTRVALPNFYNIAIRIANIAARLALLGLRLRDELRSSTSPKFVTRLNICNADIHKAAD
jgi:hypothetical protein